MESAMAFLMVLLLGQAVPWEDAVQEFQPFEEKYDELLETAAAEVVSQAIEEMRYADADKSLLVIPLQGDTKGIVTNALGNAIVGSRRYGEVRKTTMTRVMEWLKLMEIKSVGRKKDAVEIAKKYGADYVLFGHVQIGAQYRHAGRMDLNLNFRIVHVPSSDGVFIGTFSNRQEPGILSVVHHRMWIQEKSAIMRIIIWSILMLGMPFLILMFREMLGGTKPLLPVLLVVSFTALDILFAFVLMGFEIESVIQAILFVVALAAALFWNLFVVAKAAQMTRYGTE